MDCGPHLDPILVPQTVNHLVKLISSSLYEAHINKAVLIAQKQSCSVISDLCD